MLKKIIHFIKYNNATVAILAAIFILGAGAFAAGPEAIGQQQTTVQGLDNSLLLAADLAEFSMDFKIENIEQDENYYYATYSYLDIAVADSAWQYQLGRKTQKISKKIKEDLGVYLAKFLAKHHEARLRELKGEQARAQSRGAEARVAVTEYSGLIGRSLDLAAKIFPGYQAVKKVELPAPDFSALSPLINGDEGGLNPSAPASSPDNLTKIYNDYLDAHPEIFNPPQTLPDQAASSTTPAEFPPLISGDEGGLSASTTPAVEPPAVEPDAGNTPDTAEPPAGEQNSPAISENPGAGEPVTVEIIELPAAEEPPPEPVAPPEPVVEPVTPTE